MKNVQERSGSPGFPPVLPVADKPRSRSGRDYKYNLTDLNGQGTGGQEKGTTIDISLGLKVSRERC
jgi:hypothetical protein